VGRDVGVRVEVKVGEEVKVKEVDVEMEERGPAAEEHAEEKPNLQAVAWCIANMKVDGCS
jgi:hypothetical protein